MKHISKDWRVCIIKLELTSSEDVIASLRITLDCPNILSEMRQGNIYKMQFPKGKLAALQWGK